MEGDSECCDNLQCPDEIYTARLPGCGILESRQDQGFVAISWAYRDSFCPLPGWYGFRSNMNATVAEEYRNVQTFVAKWCGGLYGTPDVASCYRYGCSSEVTPIPYYGIRMIVVSVFVGLTVVPERGRPISMPSVSLPSKA